MQELCNFWFVDAIHDWTTLGTSAVFKSRHSYWFTANAAHVLDFFCRNPQFSSDTGTYLPMLQLFFLSSHLSSQGTTFLPVPPLSCPSPNVSACALTFQHDSGQVTQTFQRDSQSYQ